MSLQEPEEDPRSPFTERWYWSPMLMIVVGGGVIAYQWSSIGAGDAIALNWVMVTIGLAVAVAGLVSLKRAWDAKEAAAHDAAQRTIPGASDD
jgi:hypothetical protein